MQFILDHIVATMVGSAIFLMLAFIMADSQALIVDSTNHRALKKQELDFIKMVRRDLHGASEVLTVEESAATGEFTFRTQPDITSAAEVTVTYRREYIGMRDTTALYQIVRVQDGLNDGASMVTVTDWYIRGRNDEGGDTMLLSEVAQIYIRFEAAAPLEDVEPVGRSRWEATFHPPLLQKNKVL
jgi:hypothetical protein